MEPRVYLRALEPDDYKTSINWRRNDQIWNCLGGRKNYVSESYEKKWVEDAIFDDKSIRLAVCLKEDDAYIGNVYITDINMINRSGHIHVLIGEMPCWGKGYATEACLQLIEYAFNERGLHRLTAHILEGNIASQKTFLKCGFNQEGVLRESVFKNGKWQNQVVMSLLEDEYRNR